jgi:hypothetical protein
MPQFCLAFVLIAAGSVPLVAQRFDGCGSSQSPSTETRDRGLRDAGYSLTRDSLVSALSDRRPDVRSVAAQKLAEIGARSAFAPIMQASITEEDGCTVGAMNGVLTRLMRGIAWDTKLHPGGQYRVTPFQACTQSDRPIISLSIEQTTDPYFSGPAVRISFRNQTPQTLAFVKTLSPMDLFSATVLSPTGEHAKVTSGKEWMYEPLVHSDTFHHSDSFRLAFQPLPPNEDVSWIWRIGDDFDMSVPGMYRVSFGGRIG